jgi:hypothetical protein
MSAERRARGRRGGWLLSLAFIAMTATGASASAESDRGLAERLQAALDAELAGRGAALSLSLTEGRVTLSGRVRLYRDKLAGERVVRAIAPQLPVANAVRVEPLMPAADRDIERAIIGLGKLNRFQGAELRIAVEAGGVRIGGVFHDPRDVWFLTEQIAAIEGVRAIEIDAHYPV